MATINDTNMSIALKLAANICLDEDVELFDSLDISNVNISKKIVDRVHRAIYHDRANKVWQKCQVILKRAAVVCLIMGTLLFATAMTIKPVRAAFWNAIITWYDDYMGIHFTGTFNENIDNIPETPLIPSYIPTGWNMTNTFSNELIQIYELEGEHGEFIIYQQTAGSKEELWIDDTDCELEEIVLHDNRNAYLCKYPNNVYKLIWEDRFVFSLQSENVERDTLIYIAESIEK